MSGSTPTPIRSSATIFFRGFRASGNPHPHPRVSYYFPSARQVPPTVRYPPSPSARQLLSSFPRVRYASGAPHSRSARQPFSKLLFALPRVRYLPSSARQFRPYSHPLVSYYFPSAHQVTSILIRASATIFLPRVRYGTPIRASAMRQALPTPGPRVSLFRSCYSPGRASGTSPLARVSSTPTSIRSSATIFLPRIR